MKQTEQQAPTLSKLPILDDEPYDAEVDEPLQPGQPQQPTPPQTPVEPEPEEETPEELTQIVPPITQEPITEGQPQVAAAAAQQPPSDQPAKERPKQRTAPLIPPPAPDEHTADEDYAIQYTDESERAT